MPIQDFDVVRDAIARIRKCFLDDKRCPYSAAYVLIRFIEDVGYDRLHALLEENNP